MRTLVDIGEREIEVLDQIAKARNVSRAALIRQAIDGYLVAHRKDAVTEAFGLWAEHKVDGLAYQEALRSEW